MGRLSFRKDGMVIFQKGWEDYLSERMGRLSSVKVLPTQNIEETLNDGRKLPVQGTMGRLVNLGFTDRLQEFGDDGEEQVRCGAGDEGGEDAEAGSAELGGHSYSRLYFS